MSPLISQGSPTKGNQIRSGGLTPAFSVAQKRAEMLRHPCILGDPQQRGTKSELGATQYAIVCALPSNATSASWPFPLVYFCCTPGSPNKGTKSKVAHKWAEVLCNPYVLPKKGFKNGLHRAPRKNPIVGVHKGGP